MKDIVNLKNGKKIADEKEVLHVPQLLSKRQSFMVLRTGQTFSNVQSVIADDNRSCSMSQMNFNRTLDNKVIEEIL